MPKFTHKDYNDFKKNINKLSIETHLIEREKNKNKKFNFIDLFCGIGGIRSAFESAGGGCVFSSDIDDFARYTYYKNFNIVPFGDIVEINKNKNLIPIHDILCAGFPCQPFSYIGQREGFKHQTQGTMFYEILHVLDDTKPKFIFLENVPGMADHDKGNTLKIILKELEKREYNCSFKTLNSYDFGVPQNRRRFYLVGIKNGPMFEFPNIRKNHIDIGDYLEKNISNYSISEHLQKSYLYKKNDGRPITIDKNTKGGTRTLVSSYHKIQRLTGTFVKDGPTGLRLLTENECKVLMGFPKEFFFPVSRTQMYRQLGNSVVIPVVKKIAKEIIKYLN